MPDHLRIDPNSQLQGDIIIPGDKSITHRALMLGALMPVNCEVVLSNWLQSLDCVATLKILQKLGVKFSDPQAKQLRIKSVGLNGLRAPDGILDVGNSGTTIRLLSGILAAQQFDSVITGDASIQRRPMRRIITPLRLMGAEISASDDEYAPLYIRGGQSLRAIAYKLPIASAQLKSCLLLAGLYAEGDLQLETAQECRDHTEIMLAYLASVKNQSEVILEIPGDFSAAAFFIVGACIQPGAKIRLPNIGVNPTRTALLRVLQQMGANIRLEALRTITGELRADIEVCAAKELQGVEVPAELIANLIDEIPALCLAAACAQGDTTIRGAAELRYKESDRIRAMVQGLRAVGIPVTEYADGLKITGGQIMGGCVDAMGDHRIAMTFTLAGLVAKEPILIQNAHNIETSFPDFVQVARQAGLLVEVLEKLEKIDA